MKETLITPAGLVRLTAELERLRTDGRREIAESLRSSVATGADLNANTDYHAAREEQAALESRIAQLEERLDSARVVEADAANGLVDLGERVRLRDLDTGSTDEYHLVGALETDPTAGRISVESPVGRAVIGKRRGDIAVVDAPIGLVRLRIVAIDSAVAEYHTRRARYKQARDTRHGIDSD